MAIVGNTFADQLRVHGYLETLLLQHTKENPVSVRNLGWAGDMLTKRDRPTNFPTEESTLVDHKTDVIIGCFGMGESFEGEEGLEAFKKDLADFITSHHGKKYNGTDPVRLILVSPIAHEDLGKLTPMKEKRNVQLESYTKAMAEVAETHEVPFVDLFAPTKYVMEEKDAPKLTTNGIHLNPYGYWAVSKFMFESLISEDKQPVSDQIWEIVIDAKEGKSSSKGVALDDVKIEKGSIRFTVKEEIGPTLAPPIGEELPPQLREKQDKLVVQHLPAGDYRLTVDGEEVVTASAGEWDFGVVIDSTPAHKEAEALREAVNDKNLQFVYSWKAYNQVHIVGERKKSPSGRALPGEVIEFNEISKKRDAKLRSEIVLKTRAWRLERVGK